MFMAIGIRRLKTDEPIIKVEMYATAHLTNAQIITHLLKLIKNSTGKTVPWTEDLYPMNIPNTFETSISCFLKFQNLGDMFYFIKFVDSYKFSEPD